MKIRIETIHSLRNLSISGVATIKFPDKKILLINSNNILAAISRNLYIIPDNSVITIIEKNNLRIARDIALYNCYLNIKDKAAVINPPRIIWQVRVRLRPSPDNKEGVVEAYSAFVELFNSRSSVVVGIFPSIKEAEEWKKKSYPRGVVRRLVKHEDK